MGEGVGEGVGEGMGEGVGEGVGDGSRGSLCERRREHDGWECSVVGNELRKRWLVGTCGWCTRVGLGRRGMWCHRVHGVHGVHGVHV